MSAAGDVLALTRQLVEIESINPSLVPGGSGEARIAEFVAAWLERAGAEVEVTEVAPGRPNVVARVRGRAAGRRLLLNGHLDTVGTEGMDQPFVPAVRGGRLYGRGAYDMKGGLAAAMVVAARAVAEPLDGDLIVAAVVDEEVASLGSQALAPTLRADAAIVVEPTELELCIAHKGFVWIEIESRGIAAHGSRPDLGRDAIVGMRPALDALAALQAELADGPTHPLLGTASVHASLIEGGRELSTYPDHCLLHVEWRTLPGQTATDVERRLRRRLADDGLGVRSILERPGHAVDRDDPIVQTILSHHPTSVVGVPYWADSALFGAAGIPAVLFGPGGGGAHAVDEWLDLESLDRCCDVLWAVARDFCVVPAEG